MTKKEILQAADDNAMNYCMHRGVAKAAFVEGALWAMKKSRKIIEKAKNDLDTECHEEEM